MVIKMQNINTVVQQEISNLVNTACSTNIGKFVTNSDSVTNYHAELLAPIFAKSALTIYKRNGLLTYVSLSEAKKYDFLMNVGKACAEQVQKANAWLKYANAYPNLEIDKETFDSLDPDYRDAAIEDCYREAAIEDFFTKHNRAIGFALKFVCVAGIFWMTCA
jgi:hypothetical protein